MQKHTHFSNFPQGQQKLLQQSICVFKLVTYFWGTFGTTLVYLWGLLTHLGIIFELKASSSSKSATKCAKGTLPQAKSHLFGHLLDIIFQTVCICYWKCLYLSVHLSQLSCGIVFGTWILWKLIPFSSEIYTFRHPPTSDLELFWGHVGVSLKNNMQF